MTSYHHIVSMIRERINAGIYKPGEKIPSVREIAVEFDCNKLTVQRAFELLKDEGLLENIIGSGSFVRFPEVRDTSHVLYDFRTASLSDTFLPSDTIQSIMQSLTNKSHTLFGQSTPEGDEALRVTLGKRYGFPPNRILIISGAQQGLDITAKALDLHGDEMVFEDPTYPGALSLFKPRHFMPLGNNGPDTEILSRHVNNGIRLIYTMPFIHSPTGTTYSSEVKKTIATMVRAHGLYIIEDDYLSDLQPAAQLRFADIIPERTIFIKSLSKVTAPGLRIGFMVVPDDLYNRFIDAKFLSDIASPPLIQAITRQFLDDPAFDTHIALLRKISSERRVVIEKLLKQYAYLTTAPTQQGYSLWIHSKKDITILNAPWTPGARFSFNPEHRAFFRLSFMNMNDTIFKQGYDYLKSIFDRMEVV